MAITQTQRPQFVNSNTITSIPTWEVVVATEMKERQAGSSWSSSGKQLMWGTVDQADRLGVKIHLDYWLSKSFTAHGVCLFPVKSSYTHGPILVKIGKCSLVDLRSTLMSLHPCISIHLVRIVRSQDVLAAEAFSSC